MHIVFRLISNLPAFFGDYVILSQESPQQGNPLGPLLFLLHHSAFEVESYLMVLGRFDLGRSRRGCCV